MQDVSLDQAAGGDGHEFVLLLMLFFRYLGYSQTFLEYFLPPTVSTVAVELLQRTDIPVREIAVRVGYTDANYFTKVFKRHLGVTPTEYRNHNAKLNEPRGGNLRNLYGKFTIYSKTFMQMS